VEGQFTWREEISGVGLNMITPHSGKCYYLTDTTLL